MTIQEIYDEHLKKEPKEKWDKNFLKFDMQHPTSEWARWEFDRKRIDALIQLGQEKREEILKEIKTGKKLGEVCKIFNLSLDIVSDVLYYNIKSIHVLEAQSI